MIPRIIFSSHTLSPKPSIDLMVSPAEEAHLKISFVRSIQSFLKSLPLKSNLKEVYILDADRLTLPAQNALLKILEEPPVWSQITLTTSHRDRLLPTIISRCFIESPSNSPSSPKPSPSSFDLPSLLQSLESATVYQRVAYASSYAQKRETANQLVVDLIHFLRLELHLKPTILISRRLRLLNQISSQLAQNLNPYLAIEHLFIHW